MKSWQERKLLMVTSMNSNETIWSRSSVLGKLHSQMLGDAQVMWASSKHSCIVSRTRVLSLFGTRILRASQSPILSPQAATSALLVMTNTRNSNRQAGCDPCLPWSPFVDFGCPLPDTQVRKAQCRQPGPDHMPAMLPIKALLQNLEEPAPPKPVDAVFQQQWPSALFFPGSTIRLNFSSPLPQRQKQGGGVSGGDSEQRSDHVPQDTVSGAISPLVLEWQTRRQPRKMNTDT